LPTSGGDRISPGAEPFHDSQRAVRADACRQVVAELRAPDVLTRLRIDLRDRAVLARRVHGVADGHGREQVTTGLADARRPRLLDIEHGFELGERRGHAALVFRR
jgi:hypothetical protein